jgi:hypothetical protein
LQIIAKRTLDAVKDESSQKKSDSLLWVVSRVGEYTWINSMFYPIMAHHDNTIYHCMDKVVIKNIFPDSLDEFTSAVSHELATLGIPVWVLT